jgi:pilus assembly protein Flp/PilA
MVVRRPDELRDRGASSVEYGLLIAGIAGMIVLIVFALGPMVRESFDNTCDQIQAEQGSAECADGS